MPGRAADTVTLIHYNDVYNVEPRETEPVGGAARFATAVKTYADLEPLILFSGDIFAPSISKNSPEAHLLATWTLSDTIRTYSVRGKLGLGMRMRSVPD